MPDSKNQPAHPSFRAQVHPPHPSEHPPKPVYEISVANSRKLDELATTKFHIPSIVLMENAAIGLSAHAVEMLQSTRTQSIIIATGPGNNAGDGFALARHLHNLGYSPTIVLAAPPEKITADAKINLDIISMMNIPMIEAEQYLKETTSTPGLIVDALFGTGLTRPVTSIAATLINHINFCKQAGTQVLAVDVPSGLDAQTGKPLSDAVIHATRTVTFAALKDGYRNIEAQPFLSEVHIAPIGIPTQLLDQLATKVHPPQDRT